MQRKKAPAPKAHHFKILCWAPNSHKLSTTVWTEGLVNGNISSNTKQKGGPIPGFVTRFSYILFPVVNIVWMWKWHSSNYSYSCNLSLKGSGDGGGGEVHCTTLILAKATSGTAWLQASPCVFDLSGRQLKVVQLRARCDDCLRGVAAGQTDVASLGVRPFTQQPCACQADQPHWPLGDLHTYTSV